MAPTWAVPGLFYLKTTFKNSVLNTSCFFQTALPGGNTRSSSTCVEDTVAAHSDEEHASTEHVTRVVSFDAQLVVNLHSLMQTDHPHLLHAVLDVLRGEELVLFQRLQTLV